ncbi:MAG: DEAD/DEAH box helicase family protein [Pyrinomonadaceae bacterium]|nr:DEAD/DEAH box helicase family protein [Pyrinomonadaceae bacterium]
MNEIVLRPFQTKAAEETLIAIDGFNYGVGILPNGIPYPSVRLISAITGAGKTPILAKIAGDLDNSIILWTTPASAVITQTVYKLQNQYRNILGGDVKVYSVDMMTRDHWNTVLNSETGISILVCTVALFNIEDKEGRAIHNSGYWERLKEDKFGGERKRSRLFIVYDEGHNLTRQQANLLLELSPRAVIMASGSDQDGGGLAALMHTGGAPWSEVIPDLTTKIDTPQVVKEALLKRRIVLEDCDLDRRTILKRTIEKRNYLEALISDSGVKEEKPIACYIVNGTKAGIDIWDDLRALGVPATEIAVHLSGAKKAVQADVVPRVGFFDSYTSKLTPIEIKETGFTHIIWNKSLKEGWDEPWAFVAYIDGVNSSIKDIQQKIGRFIRNPFRNDSNEPAIPADEELQCAYFYLQQDNEQFRVLLTEVRKEMAAKYPGVIEVVRGKREYQVIQPRESLNIPKLSIRQNRKKLEQLLDEIILKPATEDCSAPGIITTGEVNLEEQYSRIQKEEKFGTIVQTTVADVVKEALRQGDKRLVEKGWIDPELWETEKMKTMLAYSSPAFLQIKKQAHDYLDKVPFCLEIVESQIEWEIVPVKIALPKPDETDPKYVEMIRADNAYHEVYNGLIEGERDVANALAAESDCKWFRNPQNTGYGIGLKQAMNGSVTFYPDFVAVKNGRYYFIEPKGAHLITDTQINKLIQLPGEKFDIFAIVTNKDGSRDVYTITGKRNFNSINEAVAWILKN